MLLLMPRNSSLKICGFSPSALLFCEWNFSLFIDVIEIKLKIAAKRKGVNKGVTTGYLKF